MFFLNCVSEQKREKNIHQRFPNPQERGRGAEPSTASVLIFKGGRDAGEKKDSRRSTTTGEEKKSFRREIVLFSCGTGTPKDGKEWLPVWGKKGGIESHLGSFLLTFEHRWIGGKRTLVRYNLQRERRVDGGLPLMSSQSRRKSR